MRRYKNIISIILVICLSIGVLPVIPLKTAYAALIDDTGDLNLKNNDPVTMSPSPGTFPNPIPANGQVVFSGKWNVYVNGKLAGYDKVVKYLHKPSQKAEQYNFVQFNKIDQWVSVLDGDPTFVNANKNNFKVTISGSQRIFLRYLVSLCGAYVENWELTGFEGITGNVYVRTTPRPTANISVPQSVKEGTPVKITLSGQTFAQVDNQAANRVGISPKQVIVSFNIDGQPVFSGKVIKNTNTYSETITRTLSAGTHTLTLFVKDAVNRYTRKDVTINVVSSTPPPPPPGSIQAGIRLDLDPSSLKVGTTGNVNATIDAGSSVSSGSGPYSARFWLQVNGVDLLGKDGTAVTGLTSLSQAKYEKLISNAKPGDKVWAKVRVWDASINKTAEAETERVVMEEGKELPTPEPPPADPPEPPPVPEPPVARFIMPSEMGVGRKVKIINNSYDPDGPELYGITMDCQWEISPYNNVYDTELKPAGGYVVFNQPGVYTVTLTVTDIDGLSDTTSKNITITNKPPVARIQAPDEVIQGDEVNIYSDSYDPDGNLDTVEWTISPNEDIVGTLSSEENKLIFNKPGNYEITLTAKDTCGLSDTAKKTIIVKPAIPEAYFSYSGVPKQNRKLVLDSSGSVSSSNFPVDFSKNEWEFVPAEGATAADIKVVSSTDLKTRQVLFKKPGEYKVRLRVTNTAGNTSEWYEQTLKIYPDDPPVADFFVMATVLRDPENANKARIELLDSSYSPDGDYIAQRIWRYKYDSDNDGSFDDESWITLDDGNNVNPVLYTTQVGKYIFEVTVKETFGEETIPEFITPTDYQQDDTADKSVNDKICEVVNLQPTVDFEAIVKPQIDLSIIGVTNNTELASSINSQSNTLIAGLINKGFSVKNKLNVYTNDIKLIQGEKASIYFRAYQYPIYPNVIESVNYNYNTGIGDFGQILKYSDLPGSDNYSNIYISVGLYEHNKPKEDFTPTKYPRVSYSADSKTWYNLTPSYTNYAVWVSNGKYCGKEFRFTINNAVQSNIRYIKVLDGNGQTYDTVYVSAIAYGNIPINLPASLNDDKFLSAISSQTWRDTSSKYVIIVSDSDADFDDLQGIIDRYNAENIKAIVVGTSDLKSVGQKIANGTGGTFFEFDGTNIPWDHIEDYLSQELQEKRVITQTILIGEEIEYKKYYLDPENDSKFSERWLYTHDPTYFENSIGVADFSGEYLSAPVKSFDKVGKYDVVFQARDNPKADNRFDNYRLWSYMPLNKLVLYVHRKPIAQFAVSMVPSGENYVISITDQSYDLDHISMPNKGIQAWEWKWKEVNETTWHSGKMSGTFPVGRTYIIYLRVQDIEGAWSDPKVQVITTQNINLPPVAQFTVNPATQVINKPLNITDLSYDPNGDPIAERSWRVQKPDGTWINYGSTLPTNIPSLGVGTYTIELKVRDNPKFGTPLWSEPYTQTVTIIPDNNKPVARFTIGPNPVVADEPYVLNDTSYDPDGDPIVAREWKVQKPDGSWVTINQWKPTFDEMGLGDDGTYKIQLRVLDDPSRRHPALTPMWSDPYTVTVQVQGRLIVIGDSNKTTYRAGEAMILTARTEGKAYKVEAKMWYPKNEFTSSNVTTLVPDTPLNSPPQDVMTWHTKHTKAEGRDVVVIIPKNMPDGNYQVVFTAYKQLAGGGTKTTTDTITVRVKGTIYDHSKSQIIGPRF